MYCTHCGIEMDEKAFFCFQCGTATQKAQTASAPRSDVHLSRPREEAKIAGVCAGVARYFGIDVTIVRIVWLLLLFYPPGAGLIAYIVCWIVMPRDPLPVAASMNTVQSA